jgi:hypothetical protein
MLLYSIVSPLCLAPYFLNRLAPLLRTPIPSRDSTCHKQLDQERLAPINGCGAAAVSSILRPFSTQPWLATSSHPSLHHCETTPHTSHDDAQSGHGNTKLRYRPPRLWRLASPAHQLGTWAFVISLPISTRPRACLWAAQNDPSRGYSMLLPELYFIKALQIEQRNRARIHGMLPSRQDGRRRYAPCRQVAGAVYRAEYRLG